MGIPIDSILNTVKLGASVRGEADVSVRVAVFVDATATPFLIDAIPGGVCSTDHLRARARGAPG